MGLSDLPDRLDALVPRGPGHQFVFYGDACSGVAGARHETTFARTNAAIARLTPGPEFIVFGGDEIVGLTTDEAELRAQWRHWLEVEMAWLDRTSVPLYHTTSNHTTFDTMSERVFTEVLADLPRNGPPGQEGLSYFVRRNDLLLVFVHTSWSGLGGEGHVESEWLDTVLGQHADARFKLIVGHHPVFPVNGFSGEHQRELGKAGGAAFWDVLVRHRVLAYLCSHILAFDVQVRDGVLQVVSAGAGTAHRMPDDTEYLHFVQGALDERGLRYQVVDHAGSVRESLAWPLSLPPSADWEPLPNSTTDPSPPDTVAQEPTIVAIRVTGTTIDDGDGRPQTLLSAWPRGTALPSIWIGLVGLTQRLCVTVAPTPGRSPHYWFGPELELGRPFDFQLALHTGMGPGGIMHRRDDGLPWSSLTSSSPWGLERVAVPRRWTVGTTTPEAASAPFRGDGLSASATTQSAPVTG